MRGISIVFVFLIYGLGLLAQDVTKFKNYSNQDADVEPYPNKKEIGFYMGFGFEQLSPDFSEYESTLGEYNTEYLSYTDPVIFNAEIGGSINRYCLAINVGWRHQQSDDFHDSLTVEYNSTQYGINLGYNIISTKDMLLTPIFAIKWNKYRLLNYKNEWEIPLDEYVENKDLDVRMNLITGHIGLKLTLKLYPYKYLTSDYFAVGVYGGYLFNITNEPWIYSAKNRLTDNNSIMMEDYYFGILFSYNFISNRYNHPKPVKMPSRK